MYFNSLVFAAFFAVVLAVTHALRSRVRPRNLFLLAASYVFYGWWDWRFLSLILISTVVDYTVGLRLGREGTDRRRKSLLTLSVVTNLGLLGVFKYFDFFIDSTVEILGWLGLNANLPMLHVVLPVGISFYTFQTMSYTIDVYRRKFDPEPSFLNFAVFVCFFPQLVAGPIERARNLLPQFRRESRVSWNRFSSGWYLICWGLFKKVVLADNIGLVSDAVFAGGPVSGLDVILGVYAFAIQIYCDFSGYSDIARGAARMLGFELMLNFNLPYFAVNPSDFWRRWHISLSSWLRDYLYISLGGNRFGSWRTYRNLLLTMLLGGLWHGAAWNFVLWGAFHGALLVGYRLWEQSRSGREVGEGAPPLLRGVQMCVFFHLVCLGWLFFRADSWPQITSFLSTLGGWALSPSLALTAVDPRSLATFLSISAVFWAAQWVQWLARDLYVVWRMPVWARSLVYAAIWLGFLAFGNFYGEQFIYFQF